MRARNFRPGLDSLNARLLLSGIPIPAPFMSLACEGVGSDDSKPGSDFLMSLPDLADTVPDNLADLQNGTAPGNYNPHNPPDMDYDGGSTPAVKP